MKYTFNADEEYAMLQHIYYNSTHLTIQEIKQLKIVIDLIEERLQEKKKREEGAINGESNNDSTK